MPRRTRNEDLAKPHYLTASDEGAATRHSHACAWPCASRRRRRNANLQPGSTSVPSFPNLSSPRPESAQPLGLQDTSNELFLTGCPFALEKTLRRGIVVGDALEDAVHAGAVQSRVLPRGRCHERIRARGGTRHLIREKGVRSLPQLEPSALQMRRAGSGSHTAASARSHAKRRRARRPV